MLREAERERYLRQLSIDGFGEEAQEKLAGARVLVAGAGGLGCSVSLYLAAAGIGRLRVVDQGNVELSNLNRQVLYAESEIGQPKVSALARRIAGLNGNVQVEPLHTCMDADSMPSLARGCDLLIDALDNLPTRFLLNKAAVRLGVPLIHGAVNGFHGQLMTIVPGATPCLRCLYQDVAAQGVTPVIGVSPGVIGLLQATETIKVLTGLGRTLKGRLLLFDGLEMSFTELEILRDPHCPHCGTGRAEVAGG